MCIKSTERNGGEAMVGNVHEKFFTARTYLQNCTFCNRSEIYVQNPKKWQLLRVQKIQMD